MTFRVRYGASFYRPAEDMRVAVAIANSLIAMDLSRQLMPAPAIIEQRDGEQWREVAVMYGGED